jgi:hypothetical protein
MADLVSLSALRACGLITMQVYLPPTPDLFPEDHPQRNQQHEVDVYQRSTNGDWSRLSRMRSLRTSGTWSSPSMI